MKKISLKSIHLKEMEQLSREQLKNVLGGYNGGTGAEGGGTTTVGKCVECIVDSGPNSGAVSCWFTKETSPNDLCSRVYQNTNDTGTGSFVDCYPGCVMN